MLALFAGVADEILVALDDRADDGTEAALAAVADRVIRYPYAEPVDRPLAWIHSECRGGGPRARPAVSGGGARAARLRRLGVGRPRGVGGRGRGRRGPGAGAPRPGAGGRGRRGRHAGRAGAPLGGRGRASR